MPIVRMPTGRLCVQLGAGTTAHGVLETLRDAFDAVSGPGSGDGTADGWQEVSVGGFRFTVEWSRWRGCRIVSDEPAGQGTLRKIATWFQEDREAW